MSDRDTQSVYIVDNSYVQEDTYAITSDRNGTIVSMLKYLGGMGSTSYAALFAIVNAELNKGKRTAVLSLDRESDITAVFDTTKIRHGFRTHSQLVDLLTADSEINEESVKSCWQYVPERDVWYAGPVGGIGVGFEFFNDERRLKRLKQFIDLSKRMFDTIFVDSRTASCDETDTIIQLSDVILILTINGDGDYPVKASTITRIRMMRKLLSNASKMGDTTSMPKILTVMTCGYSRQNEADYLIRRLWSSGFENEMSRYQKLSDFVMDKSLDCIPEESSHDELDECIRQQFARDAFICIPLLPNGLLTRTQGIGNIELCLTIPVFRKAIEDTVKRINEK